MRKQHFPEIFGDPSCRAEKRSLAAIHQERERKKNFPYKQTNREKKLFAKKPLWHNRLLVPNIYCCS